MDFTKFFAEYFAKEHETIQKLDLEEINLAINAIKNAWLNGNQIYSMGNGGSASTASHMVCDFNKNVSLQTGHKFNMICLNDNLPIMMAIANDISYDQIFKLQLQDNVKAGDLIIAFSGSGNSNNVIQAVEYAKKQEAVIVGVTGYDGGKLRKISDYNMHVPCNDMQVAEDLHLAFVHMIMRAFYQTQKN